MKKETVKYGIKVGTKCILSAGIGILGGVLLIKVQNSEGSTLTKSLMTLGTLSIMRAISKAVCDEVDTYIEDRYVTVEQ